MTQPLQTTSPAQKESSEANPTLHDWTSRVTRFANALVRAIAQHWLLIFNTAMGLYATLPALPPVLMKSGHPRAAGLLYTLFTPLCHQLPERSFFLFGPRFTYTLAELERHIGPEVPLRYTGSAALGYKLAICERDTAMFVAIWLAGLAFVLVRRRVRPLSVKAFALTCVPMAVDGLGQLVGLWESTWWSRVLTGSLFGVGCIWLAYPLVEDAMQDVRKVVNQEPKGGATP